MITHDATLVISALTDLGGESDCDALERQVSSRLAGCFVHALEILLDNDLVRPLRNLRTSRCASRCEGTGVNFVALNPQKFLFEIDRHRVDELVARSVDRRNFSASYQAVVAGKSVRAADPLQSLIERMSRGDREEFLKNWEKLSETERAAYRADLARPARRGGRDGSPASAGAS